MREYRAFLKELKYVIINSGILEEEEKRKKTPKISNKEYANAVIDISHWEENVDFKLAKRDGIVGIIHKVTQGTKYVDPKYAKRRKEAEDLGLLWGAYHFGTGENGKDQASHFLEVVGKTQNTILTLDIEENRQGKNITMKQAEDFVETIQKVTGRLPLIYGNADFLENFATPILTRCPLWIARWEEKPILPKGWDNWVLWQYTDGNKGPEPHKIRGIGRCDRNKFNGTVEELKKFWLSEYRN